MTRRATSASHTRDEMCTPRASRKWVSSRLYREERARILASARSARRHANLFFDGDRQSAPWMRFDDRSSAENDVDAVLVFVMMRARTRVVTSDRASAGADARSATGPAGDGSRDPRGVHLDVVPAAAHLRALPRRVPRAAQGRGIPDVRDDGAASSRAFADADAAPRDAAGEYGSAVSADDAAALNKRAEEIKTRGRARTRRRTRRRPLRRSREGPRSASSVFALNNGGVAILLADARHGRDGRGRGASGARRGESRPSAAGGGDGSSADPSSSSAAAGRPRRRPGGRGRTSLAGTRPPSRSGPGLDAVRAASFAEESGSRETLARHSVPPEPSASDPEALVLA